MPDTQAGTLRGGLLRNVLDDLADDMSQTVSESKWAELLIYLLESMERKAKDRAEFDSMMYRLLE